MPSPGPNRWLEALWIGLGGFLGANARALVGAWLGPRTGSAFPWPTLVINITGSFALGLLSQYLATHTATPLARPILAIGFLGAYTTYSTFELEIWTLGGTSLARATLYVALSLGLGLAAVEAGVRLGRGWG